jgi:UDP-N-acetylglucosamine 2-epimerase (non-hydrolysing)
MSKIKKRILSIFGTRPEAIKMAPLIQEIERSNKFDSKSCVTAQHREMLDDVLSVFSIVPDYDLNLMKEKQDLWGLTSSIINKTKEVYHDFVPDLVLVHGDTTTAFASALSAFYANIKVGHVEAGLRSFDNQNPFPEEINRVMIDNISTLHFAPTKNAVKNLLLNGIKKDNIFLTQNTVIDSLLLTSSKVSEIKCKEKIILLTIHRRENFGEPLEKIFNAILKLVSNNPGIKVIYPVHPNPNVKNLAYELLGNQDRVILKPAQNYVEFVKLMKSSYLIITDSGGIQEEAPSLGKPVLVTRKTTERPEALQAGGVRLVGCDEDKIIKEVELLLNNVAEYKKMSKIRTPYGDGKASKKILESIIKFYDK